MPKILLGQSSKMPSLGNGSGSQNPSEKKLSGSQAIGALEQIKRQRNPHPKEWSETNHEVLT
jgi:hypothetical protein